MPQRECLQLSEIEDQLTSWLSERSCGMRPQKDENYLESGVIDSYGLIMLIEDIEDRYSFQFDIRELQDVRFTTVSGLAGFIYEKVGLLNI